MQKVNMHSIYARNGHNNKLHDDLLLLSATIYTYIVRILAT